MRKQEKEKARLAKSTDSTQLKSDNPETSKKSVSFQDENEIAVEKQPEIPLEIDFNIPTTETEDDYELFE